LANKMAAIDAIISATPAEASLAIIRAKMLRGRHMVVIVLP